MLDNARRSLPALYDRALPAEGALAFCDTITTAAAGADWIQESVPERLEFEHEVLAEIQRHAPEHAVLAFSTSGFKPSDLQHVADRLLEAVWRESLWLVRGFEPWGVQMYLVQTEESRTEPTGG